MPLKLYIIRINAYVGEANIEPFDVVVSSFDVTLLSRIIDRVLDVIGDICNTNDDMLSI